MSVKATNANTPMWVRDVTEQNFESEVLQVSEQVPVVVDFWSPHCAPCRTLGPILERLITERQGKLRLAKVNVDENPRLAAYFQISAIPAIKVIWNRQLVDEFEGLQPESTLRQYFQQLVPEGSESEGLETEVDEQADPAGAEARYREQIEREPDQHQARVGLARVLLRQNRLDEIPEVLEPVGVSGELGAQAEGLLARVALLQQAKTLPDVATLTAQVAQQPRDAQAHLQLGLALAAAEEYPQALQELLLAAELDSTLATGKAREIMVRVFYALGTNHPLANEYRSRLSRLLY